MGTNFYCKRIPTQDQLNEIADLVINRTIDEAIDKLHEVNKQIHICKRSSGWQIGFDHNNGEYWQPTRKSLEEFLSQSNILIVDEYKKEYTYEEFWKEIDEHNADPNNNWDSASDIAYNTMHGYRTWICKEDIKKVKELFNIDTNTNDFTVDGLRFNVFTDFS
jgi:hypothetical protein